MAEKYASATNGITLETIGKGSESSRSRSAELVLSMDALVEHALLNKPNIRGTPTVLKTFNYDAQKTDFENLLVRSAKITKTEEPEEISKIQVDVNEKIYSNQGRKGDGDKTTISIIKKAESSEGYNYEQQTTKGLQWGAGTNLGAQFGLSSVGIGPSAGLSGGVNASFKKTNQTTTTESTTTTNKTGQESNHTESVTIPPGQKVKVSMTSYRVKYRLVYSMEYKVEKIKDIRVRYKSSMDCLGLCSIGATLTAEELLRYMPDYRMDERYVYFTQKGSLTWMADRVEVDKTLMPQQ